MKKKIFGGLLAAMMIAVATINLNLVSNEKGMSDVMVVNNEALADFEGIGIDINNDVCVCKNSTCKQAAFLYTNPQCGKGSTEAACNLHNSKCY